MSILIGADIVPTPSNIPLFESGDVITLVGKDLYDILMGADYRIFNLETPLADKKSPIRKNGSNFLAPTDCITGLEALRADLLSLANNHIMDQGAAGLASTIRAISEKRISFVGAGEDIFDAQKPFISEHHGKRIGVYSCTEHEFSIADEDNAGANPFDPFESLDHISELSKKTDYTLVLYHGGKEYYRYPSPNLQKTCRKIVEKGADLVICQHSHCIGCEENYGKGKIVYGQGNFIFDCDDNACFQTGLLVEITDELQVNYIPIVKQGNKICLAKQPEAKEILEGFYQRSEQITSQQFVTDSYSLLSEKNIDNYLYLIFGYKKSLITRFLIRIFGQEFISWLIGRKLTETNISIIQNVMECETHHELLIAGIKYRSAE